MATSLQHNVVDNHDNHATVATSPVNTNHIKFKENSISNDLTTKNLYEDSPNNHTKSTLSCSWTNEFDMDGLDLKSHCSSGTSSSNTNSNNKFASTKFRGNLTRLRNDTDPYEFYHVMTILGVGSMGSVCQVRKKDNKIGGSARKEIDKSKLNKHNNDCVVCIFGSGIIDFLTKGNYSLRKGSILLEDCSIQEEAGSYVSKRTSNTRSSVVTELVYAIKSIHLNRVKDESYVEELKNEIEILKSLDHPNIVRAIETYSYDDNIHVIMELCSGGDLYTRDPYTEEQAARITSSILNAVSYMHSKGICHRDLKYENILFVDNSPHAQIKLIDFGLSKTFIEKDEMTQGVGTIYTMAPEVIMGSYTKQADIWSIGVIAFMLMSSQMPFYGRERSHIIEQILAGRFAFKGRRWKRVSKQGKAFIEDLLVLDPDDRVTAEEALGASWLIRRYGATARNPIADEIFNAKTSILNYAGYSKLKKMALMVVAHQCSCQEIGYLRKLFQLYDTSGDGQLSYDEFRSAITDAGFVGSEAEYQHVFDAMNIDGTNFIRYTEFLAATIEALGVVTEEKLAEAFDHLDSDDSGFIDAKNLIGMLGNDFPEEEIKAIIDEADVNRDGNISYAEFLALWDEYRVDTGGNDVLREITFSNSEPPKWDSERSASISILSGDETTSDYDQLARASFVEGKKLSERKMAAVLETRAGEKPKKNVMFKDTATTIPMTESVNT